MFETWGVYVSHTWSIFQKWIGQMCDTCWWFRNPANQLRLVAYPSICRGVHPRWWAGFLPSTVPLPPVISNWWAPSGQSFTGFWGNDWQELPSAYERCPQAKHDGFLDGFKYLLFCASTWWTSPIWLKFSNGLIPPPSFRFWLLVDTVHTVHGSEILHHLGCIKPRT